MARSPYLEAKVNRWCQDEKELVIDDCDPDTFNIIVDYMYGSPIPSNVVTSAFDKSSVPTEDRKNYELKKYFSGKLQRLTKVLRMSDMMQMIDLKCELEELLVKFLEDPWFNVDSARLHLCSAVLVLIDPAVLYNCEKLLLTCARKLSSCGVVPDLEMAKDVVQEMPQFAAALLVAYGNV